MAQNGTPTDPWLVARGRYVEDLDEEEKMLFVTASLDNLFHSANAAQRDHEEKSRSRAISKKLEPFVASIDQFGVALDIAKTFEKYFKKLIDMFMWIGDILPRCRVYWSLFPSHEQLLQAISLAYLDVIHFCVDAKAIFRKLGGLRTVPFALKILWKDLNGDALSKFRYHVKNVEKEAGLSNLIEASAERDLALANRAEQERQRKIQKRELLLSQLSSLRYVDKHLKERKRRYPGTGSWLTETAQFKEWRIEGRSTCLWCYGIPGSGKTVLASSLIDTLSMDATGKDITIQSTTSQDIIESGITSQDTAIAYYYCDFSDLQSLEIRNILGTIIRELLENVAIPDDLEQRIEQLYRHGTRTAIDDELISVLCTVIKCFSEVYICIDGIDECGKDEQITILSMVDQLAQSHDAAVKIFITSREETTISASLRKFLRLRVSADKNSRDITTFVGEAVKSNIRSGTLTIRDPSLESDIISALTNGADGMFLWVHFQLADLCGAVTDSGVRETLRNLPKGMAETYARVLRKIGGSHANVVLAQRIFKWVICAKRPLLITELGEAVAFGPTDLSWDAEGVPSASRLIQACRSLVVFDEDDRTVRLAHHTVQQFLLEPPAEDSIPGFHFQLPQAGVEAGEVCVAYLSFSDFETQITVPRPDVALACNVPGPVAILDNVTNALGLKYITSSIFRLSRYVRTGNVKQQPSTFNLVKFAKLKKPPPPSLREKYLLLDYVIENWLGHATGFSEDNTTMWKKFGYLAMDKPMMFDVRAWGDSNEPNDLRYTALFHWAVIEGHVPLLKLLLQLPNGENLCAYCRQESKKGRSVALGASSYGHTNVIELLAKHDCIDGRDGKPLVEAAMNGNEAVVRLLLNYGLCLEAKVEALLVAVESGHAAVIRVLFENDPQLSSDVGWDKVEMALRKVREKGFDEVLAALLRNAAAFPAVISYLERAWGSATLHMVAARGYKAVAQLLVERGADVNKGDNIGKTALHLATDNGDLAMVRLLVGKGANVNAKDNYRGWTTLHRAALSGHCPIAQLLVEKGADVNKGEGNRGLTALHLAAQTGNKAMAELLVKRGADVEKKESSHGWTALHLTAQNGHDDTALLLVEKGADVNRADNDQGWTALHLAARNNCGAMAELLLEKGAHVNKMDKLGQTALHAAAQGGHEAVVQVLLRKRADVSRKDRARCTALHLAADNGREATARLLVGEGADINVTNAEGRTALHLAAQKGHKVLALLLVKKGANVNAGFGERSLHLAAQNGHEAVVQLLIKNGANVNVNAGRGDSALHRSAQSGHMAVAQLLVGNGADVGAKDDSGWTALHEAARSGHVSVARLLVEKGADVNMGNDDGEAALHLAAHGGNWTVMKFLLENGADVGKKDKNGWTALQKAAHYERKPMARLLEENGADINNGHKAVVQLVVEKGADINVRDGEGWTALHRAVKAEAVVVVQLLVEKGANINTKDNEGRVALHWAAQNGHVAVVQLLVEKRVDTNVKHNRGLTALHLAAYERLEDVVRLPAWKAANIDAIDNAGWTVLHLAIQNGHEDVALLLLKKGANISAENDGGWTALHLAAHSGQKVVVRLLLEKGANANKKDNEGWTSLHRAAQNGHEAVAQLLVRGGADIDMKDNNRGWTVLHQAAQSGHQAVVQLLVEKGVNARDDKGWTALHLAAYSGHENVTRILAPLTSASLRRSP
ncbi:MAG: hypothetical protein M1813_005514 [Trichoglossum hirsutum]|nr:MAG: hypothetical protein M1813_005514 [Trichoglossum hirsutum]